MVIHAPQGAEMHGTGARDVRRVSFGAKGVEKERALRKSKLNRKQPLPHLENEIGSFDLHELSIFIEDLLGGRVAGEDVEPHGENCADGVARAAKVRAQPRPRFTPQFALTLLERRSSPGKRSAGSIPRAA